MPDSVFLYPLVALLACVGLLAVPSLRRPVPQQLMLSCAWAGVVLISLGMLTVLFSVDWAILVSAAGWCAFLCAVWLSGAPDPGHLSDGDQDDGPDDRGWGRGDDHDPRPEPPPAGPVDWQRFDADFRAHCDRIPSR